MNALTTSLGLALLVSSRVMAQEPNTLPQQIVQRHAAHCYERHRACAQRATELQQAVKHFVARPDAASLQTARSAWMTARSVYGQLEALRFTGGPIDAVEVHLNAWPIDESYIDHVIGRPNVGIVNDRQTYRTLSSVLLLHANERGSETNISVGWHAVEFLLWGQDTNPKGPGQRPASDFLVGHSQNVDRRGAYLTITTDLLVVHLTQLREAWAPGADNYRRHFEADVDGALRKMLTGAAILTAFELCGERLAVAYETKDQEQEHSCFSDTTAADLVANQLGILAIFTGGVGEPTTANLLALLREKDAPIATHLERSLQTTLAALRDIPEPFDQAFLGDDDAPGRRAIAAAMRALEQQAEVIAIAGRLLGFDLPMRPGN